MFFIGSKAKSATDPKTPSPLAPLPKGEGRLSKSFRKKPPLQPAPNLAARSGDGFIEKSCIHQNHIYNFELLGYYYRRQ
jgi:hypothetical protein